MLPLISQREMGIFHAECRVLKLIKVWDFWVTVMGIFWPSWFQLPITIVKLPEKRNISDKGLEHTNCTSILPQKPSLNPETTPKMNHSTFPNHDVPTAQRTLWSSDYGLTSFAQWGSSSTLCHTSDIESTGNWKMHSMGGKQNPAMNGRNPSFKEYRLSMWLSVVEVYHKILKRCWVGGDDLHSGACRIHLISEWGAWKSGRHDKL